MTGHSPVYQKANRIVLYTREALDAWATAKIGAPQKSSSAAATSEQKGGLTPKEKRQRGERSRLQFHPISQADLPCECVVYREAAETQRSFGSWTLK